MSRTKALSSFFWVPQVLVYITAPCYTYMLFAAMLCMESLYGWEENGCLWEQYMLRALPLSIKWDAATAFPLSPMPYAIIRLLLLHMPWWSMREMPPMPHSLLKTCCWGERDMFSSSREERLTLSQESSYKRVETIWHIHEVRILFSRTYAIHMSFPYCCHAMPAPCYTGMLPWCYTRDNEGYTLYVKKERHKALCLPVAEFWRATRARGFFLPLNEYLIQDEAYALSSFSSHTDHTLIFGCHATYISSPSIEPFSFFTIHVFLPSSTGIFPSLRQKMHISSFHAFS